MMMEEERGFVHRVMVEEEEGSQSRPLPFAAGCIVVEVLPVRRSKLKDMVVIVVLRIESRDYL